MGYEVTDPTRGDEREIRREQPFHIKELMDAGVSLESVSEAPGYWDDHLLQPPIGEEADTKCVEFSL